MHCGILNKCKACCEVEIMEKGYRSSKSYNWEGGEEDRKGS